MERHDPTQSLRRQRKLTVCFTTETYLLKYNFKARRLKSAPLGGDR